MVVAVMLAQDVIGQCRCPDGAHSLNLLIAVPAGGSAGLVACGYEDERQRDAVVASEFQVFRCGSPIPLLEFDALQKVILRSAASVLHVTEVQRWPFGPRWRWQDVPMYEWHLSSEYPEPHLRRTLSSRPAVTRAEIDAFLNEYTWWLAAAAEKRSYDSAEEFVGRLFTAAVAGDHRADSLFLTMGADAGLDGAAAETYSQALQTYAAWRGARPRRSKH